MIGGEAGRGSVDALVDLVISLLIVLVLLSVAAQAMNTILIVLAPLVLVVGLMVGAVVLLGGLAAFVHRRPPRPPVALPVEQLRAEEQPQGLFPLPPAERPRDVRSDRPRHRGR